MSEFDELVSRKGARGGQIRTGLARRRTQEHQPVHRGTTGIRDDELLLRIDPNDAHTMALGMTRVSPVPETWRPVNGWGASIGGYSFALHGDRFAIGQTEYLGSIDELLDLLRHEEP